jgi:signal transduction histidine kinase
MMEQILALGRVESGKTAFRPQPLDLPELCTRIASEIQSATGQAREIETHFDGELSPVMMDEGILRHVLGNLLSNAIKYSPPETPVTLQVAREGGEVRILVTDNGIGIPEPDQGKLFEAFHRASNVGDISGTGLGLLLVKRCAELHGGGISFESKVGEGSTFTVSLARATNG